MRTLATIYLILLLLPALLSCQSGESARKQLELTGKWQLTQIVPNTMLAGKASTPRKPPYTDIYEFKADSTFSRTWSTGYKAQGTYTVSQHTPEGYTVVARFADKSLSYHQLSGQDRQYSYSEGEISFEFQAPDVLIESYMASDGPSFHYQKIQEKD